jgi:hypothetical protein
MTADILFSILNTAILPAWLLLVLAPRWRWTRRIIGSGAYSFGYALVYTVLIATFISHSSSGGFSSIAAVQRLFADPWLLIAGWVHYLAFDLLVGSWIVKDAQYQGIHHGWVVPCLFLTFLFGPIGWASYQVLRAIRLKSVFAGQ